MHRWPSNVRPLGLLVLSIALACAPTPRARPTVARVERSSSRPEETVEPSTSRPEPIFGVTITDPWTASRDPAVLRALDGLALGGGRRPTVRVVFDAEIDRVLGAGEVTAEDYAGPVAAIGAHAEVMGELLDSLFVPRYDVAQLRARACEYRAGLGHLVDLWEVGNEINGEWLLGEGEPEEVVVEKLLAVIEVFEADAAGFSALCPGFAVRRDERPFQLVLTAYGNGAATGPHCWERPEHHMESWLARHFGPGSRGERAGAALDLVLVSYYEDDCGGVRPDWAAVFDRVGRIFPTARLGIGECGTERARDAARYVDRYYRRLVATRAPRRAETPLHPRFVGGMFWWYFDRDFRTPAYEVLRAARRDVFWSRR